MESPRPTLCIIVACDARNGIGAGNALPWRLPEDLAHFRRTTSGHPVLMGRKTYDSIGRALPQRRNIVITHDPAWRREGVESAPSLAAALALLADGGAGGRAAPGPDAFIIGGAQIYAQALPLADRLLVTEIGHTFECDVFFPPINRLDWQETGREEYHSEPNGFGYAFVSYRRVWPAGGPPQWPTQGAAHGSAHGSAHESSAHGPDQEPEPEQH